jgi:hypothetical protein
MIGWLAKVGLAAIGAVFLVFVILLALLGVVLFLVWITERRHRKNEEIEKNFECFWNSLSDDDKTRFNAEALEHASPLHQQLYSDPSKKELSSSIQRMMLIHRFKQAQIRGRNESLAQATRTMAGQHESDQTFSTLWKNQGWVGKALLLYFGLSMVLVLILLLWNALEWLTHLQG